MMALLAVLLVVHGVIHTLGAFKAFGWAELPQLTQPISPGLGALWLVAAVLFLATAVALFVWPRGWWAIGLGAVVLSMIAISSSWVDAKAGAVANVVVLAAAAYGMIRVWPR